MAPSVLILSLGNNIHRHNPLEIAGGIVGIAVLIFFPAFNTGIDNVVFTTAEIPDAAWLSTLFRVINLSIGFILLFFQVCNIVRWAVPDSVLKESKFLTLILRGSGVRSEFGIKQAAMKKVHNLVRHAYDLHIAGGGDRTNSVSLLNYMKLTEKRENCGGFVWAWKSFLSGDVIDEEGKHCLQIKKARGFVCCSGLNNIFYFRYLDPYTASCRELGTINLCFRHFYLFCNTFKRSYLWDIFTCSSSSG